MGQLIDQYGRPLRAADRRALTEEIARPGLTGIRQAWSPSIASGLTPSSLASVLAAAAEGDPSDYLALAEELEERDLHYASVLGTRKRSISGIEPVVKAASEDPRDKKIAEAVREHITEHDGFSDLVEDLLDGLGKGFSVVEIVWDQTATEWTPEQFIHRDARFFRFDRETQRQLLLLTDEHPANGERLAPFKFITHIPRLKSGIPIRGGLARLIAFTWICKAYTVKDWVAFAELFGLPLRLGRYDGQATKEDIEVLFRAVSMIGSDAAAVLPKSMEIDFQEISSGQGHEVFPTLAKWADQQISKAVLGQTMTSDDGASRAQAEVHNDVRFDIRRSDVRQVQGTINRDLVKPFVDLNFGVPDRYPLVQFPLSEPEDVKALVENVVSLAEAGMTFRAAEIRSRMGLTAPEKDDETFGGTSVATNILSARNNASPQENANPYDETDAIEGAAMDDWEDITAALLHPVAQHLRNASSYEEALQGLSGVMGEMDASALLQRLVSDAVASRAHGDVSD